MLRRRCRFSSGKCLLFIARCCVNHQFESTFYGPSFPTQAEAVGTLNPDLTLDCERKIEGSMQSTTIMVC